MNNKLGRLRKIELRNIWQNEANDFTPWLAGEENLQLLGDTIGIDLEFESQEKDIGPFRADIVCLNTADNSFVLIENQLEKTDHTHLGQIMTYAAGLKAVTIVWVARRFTDEHQATIEWLNDVTKENINFFGLEIELWQIGDSPTAPKFNIVAKPNEWTKSTPSVSRELSPTKQLQFNFWRQFREYAIENAQRIKPTKGLPQHWMNVSLGRSHFGMYAFVDTQKKRIGVRVFLEGADAKPHYHLLAADCEQIEAEMGEKLVWDELPDKKSSYISSYNQDADPVDESAWPAYQEWLLIKLEKFHEVLSDRIKNLDAGDYMPEEPDGEE